MPLSWFYWTLISCSVGDQNTRDTPLPQHPARLSDQAKLMTLGNEIQDNPLSVIKSMIDNPDPINRHKSLAFLESNAGENELRFMMAAADTRDKRHMPSESLH